MTRIRIEFSRFSAFYSPLIGAIAAGFLEEEGLEPEHRVSPPGRSAIASLLDGASDVAQSAPAQGFLALERGERPAFAHFAQINEMDGFFLAARDPAIARRGRCPLHGVGPPCSRVRPTARRSAAPRRGTPTRARRAH